MPYRKDSLHAYNKKKQQNRKLYQVLVQIFSQTCPFGAYMFVFRPKKFYGRLETCRYNYNHVLKPPRHQISAYMA